MKLSAEPPVGAGIILVRATPHGSVAWATGSTAAHSAASGVAADAILAHLAALEAFLDHRDHVGRRLALDVEDTPAGREVVRFAAEHLPQMQVTARPDILADTPQTFPHVREALLRAVEDAPRPSQRIVAATGASRQSSRSEAGWAWITSTGRWRTGNIRGRKELAIEMMGLFHLVSAHPDADAIHIGCSSKQAIILVHRLRTGEAGANSTLTDLRLQHPKRLEMLQTLVDHPAEITFQWVPADEDHLLAQTANRLAVQSRLALEANMPDDTWAAVQAGIIKEFRGKLPHT